MAAISLKDAFQTTLLTFTLLSVVSVFPRLAPRVSVKDRGNFGSCCYLSLSDNVINSILRATFVDQSYFSEHILKR